MCHFQASFKSLMLLFNFCKSQKKKCTLPNSILYLGWCCFPGKIVPLHDFSQSLRIFLWCLTFPFSNSKLISVNFVPFSTLHIFYLPLLCTGSQSQWYKDNNCVFNYALGTAVKSQRQWSNDYFSNIIFPPILWNPV